MKKQIGYIAALSALSTATVLGYDGKIDIADQVGLGTGSGGAFKATIVSGLSTAVTGGVPGHAVGANQFLTFCIERDEYLTLPGLGYDVNLSTSADKGGVNTNSGDPISKATAWLFERFTAGNLNTAAPGFNYNNTGGNQLQDAIWWLEEELTTTANGSSFEYLIAAALGSTTALLNETHYLAARADNYTGNQVKVMNMYNGPGQSGGYNQDLLVVVPEPSTYIAGGLALLPLLFGLRRHMAKKG